MVERDGERRRAAARPLLAYAPEFLVPVPSARATEDNDEEREHQRRREELLRRKQDLLDAEASERVDPKADMQGRMNAVREALQANLDGAPIKTQPAPAAPHQPSSRNLKSRYNCHAASVAGGFWRVSQCWAELSEPHMLFWSRPNIARQHPCRFSRRSGGVKLPRMLCLSAPHRWRALNVQPISAPLHFWRNCTFA